MIEDLFGRLRHMPLLSFSARPRHMAARVIWIFRLAPSRLFADHHPKTDRGGFASINSFSRLQKRRLLLFLPRRIEQTPDRIVDREVHVAGEDREPVVAVVGTGIIPRVHLTERNAHLLNRVLLLD